ncbi:sugar ABC transporter permease [Ruminococcus sp. CLA-AA-H200]|uniref:Sugar ABC transporter permease n=1 Tax=Ruminococcus turbiniformis TaxID=2881258 RepID=A0ABS8FY53_9FIRM|nr:sugar ABC transporter permease [Ruminococcus turbiniformis]MCC2254966.1 sugar ABC transporter permease [Ruminococcus turbiniformis]
MNRKRAQGRFVFFCIAPAAILVTLFVFIPTINVFRMSLYRMGGITNRKTFVGLNNFKSLFNDTNFLQAMQNTIAIIVLVTICTIIFAVLFAAILSRSNVKGKNFFRVIFYIPNILSIVVIAGIFGAIYNPSTGLLNTFLEAIGLDFLTQQWMGNQRIVLYSIIFALVWQAIGYYMVMYMASMAAIPEDLYEAASLDGASEMKIFFQVTLPLIWSNIRTTLTFYIISTINLSFQFVQIMSNGGPNGHSEVVLNYMYKQAYGASVYGYGMAIGVVIFVFSFALAAIVNKITDREVLEF